MPSERAIHLLIQVCHSLAEAHEDGLIHRDIKPANLYVCRYGREVDFVKVLDFGLVKSGGEEGATALNLTRDHVRRNPRFHGARAGARRRGIDGRSDIYSTGCLAYWLVTGQLVFTGRTPVDTVLQHTQTKPVPPSQRTELEIPEAFEQLILACLEKNPADRPPSAESLAASLARIETTQAWTQDLAGQWWDVHHPKTPQAPL